MGGFAWVTLATNDSYSLGALVLAHSLRRAGTKHDLAVLITPGVTQVMRDKLATVFSLVQEVNVLDSKEEANLALLARPELGITFTKLHCWRLTQYEKCVFIDADALVIRNCDELFEREELSAAPDVGWPDCFNSGVFVFQPSQQTFASITAFAAEKGSFDGGDQGLLNSYFSDWAHKDISKHLPFIYNMCSTATYSYLPAYKQYGENARIIHFIGATKPWLQYFDTETSTVHPPSGCNHLQPLLQLWWNIFCENVHSQLSPVMARSTLAPIWHRFTPYLSRISDPSYPIYDDSSQDYTYRSEKGQNYDEYLGDDYYKNPADFSEFNDPWEKYIPNSTPMENIVYYHKEYFQEQHYNDSKTEMDQRQELTQFIQQPNYQSHYNQTHSKSEEFSNELKPPSEYGGGREERYEAFNGQLEEGDETEYFETRNVEVINQRLHGEPVSESKIDTGEHSTSWDNGQTDNSAYSLPQSLSHEPCTDPLHNVAQHNEQSIDSQGHLDTEDAGIAGALAKMTLGEPRSVEQSALEEHMRRQGWEHGQIDYMGRDSFENIWKKICDTLNQPPQEEASSPKEEEQIVEVKSSLVPDATPAVEPSPTAAAETKAEVDSPKPSEEPTAAILVEEIQPLIPETIDIKTVQDQPDIAAEVKSESTEPEQENEAKIHLEEKKEEIEDKTVPEIDSAIKEITPTAQSPAKPESIISESLEPVVTAEILADVASSPTTDTNNEAKVEQFISTFEVAAAPETIIEPVDQSVKETASELSELVFDSSSVPIQVAESVLQSEPKESVSEDQRPVSEEVISSVVAPVLESVTAVSETVAEPKEEQDAKDEQNSVASSPSSDQIVSNGVQTISQQISPQIEATQSISPGIEATPQQISPEIEATPQPSAPESEAAPQPSSPETKIAPALKEVEIEKPAEKELEEEPLSAVSDSSKSASLTPPDSPSTQGPVRPARTKVPTTPTVTEATPPNSPPIGAGQNLEDQPKTVKKVVKKVVKKSSVESEGGDGTEGEVTGKKVVKKVVKKVIKKPKETAEDGAEASTTSTDKPKKVVKIVKKIVKPSESLEVDTSVPETPPAGVPVPPKRKTKITTTKSTTTTTTTTTAEAKPSESEP